MTQQKDITAVKGKNRKIKGFDILAIISTLGIIGWITTDYFGGMIIFLLSYSLIIIPIVIAFLVSFIETIVSLIRKGINQNKIKLLSHSTLIGFVILISVVNSDLFKSKRIVTATLKDNLYHYTLILRENGKCENNAFGMFGYTEKFKGEYYLKNDTIIFTIIPYDNDFLPDTVLLDTNQGAIFINKDKNGSFVTKKSWLNHFEIE
jgi:hypothetical protein